LQSKNIKSQKVQQNHKKYHKKFIMPKSFAIKFSSRKFSYSSLIAFFGAVEFQEAFTPPIAGSGPDRPSALRTS
jgi:hypothetical protein